MVLLCFTAAPSASALTFEDVPQKHWAYEEILSMSERGLIQGSDGAFRPEDSISTQAFLSMLCRASGFDDRNLEHGSDWSDPAMAFGGYFNWFDKNEITDRTAPITREFAAKLLVNAE